MQFTGKERDSETGLDYFGARYLSSAQGRFTSPDWSARPVAVPYSDLTNPQSLNLYAYVLNNPLKNRDLDGHVCIFGIGNTCSSQTPAPSVQPPAPPPPPGPPKDVPYTNLPGPQYKTLDQAGKTVVAKINPKSIKENTEYAGRVVKNVNGTYGTTEPNKGTADGSSPGTVPAGTTGAAVYHTHGAFDPHYDNENFSPQDIRSAGREGTPSYLGTPAGAIKRYDPATGTTTVLEQSKD
jgi:RHS repeat-associated protein